MKKHWLFVLAAFMMFGCAGSDSECGNGKLEGDEECDDGNLVSFDGCSPQCTKESEYVDPVCGNGKVERGEECDDGNKVDDDACNNKCKSVVVIVENPECGNGTRENDEKCDGPNSVASLNCDAYDSSTSWKAGGHPSCSSDCELEKGSCQEAVSCGNGIKEGNEECDGTDGLPSTCASWKPTVNWSNSSAQPACEQCQIVAGACVAELCGNGRIDDADGETCDPKDSTVFTCNDFDGLRTWKSGGVPTCSAQTCTLEQGSCVEDKCKNNILDTDAGEVCDPTVTLSTLTCSDLDPDKTWKSGGEPSCSDTCELEVGTCVEEKCGNGFRDEDEGEDCDWNTMGADPEPYPCAMYDDKYESGNVTCSKSCKWNLEACVEKTSDTCGNGEPDEGETCDWGKDVTTRECSEANPDYEANPEITGAMAKCNSCALDLSECVRKSSGGTGLVWCQTMDPTRLLFDANSADKTVSVRYGIGSDVDVSRMDAKLVYGYDFKTIESEAGTPWTIKDATHNSAEKRFTATLSKSDVTDFWATGDDEVYFTFKISIDGGENWVYCKTDEDHPAVENTSLKPVTIAPDVKPSNFNEHTTGYASYSKILIENFLTFFSFDSAAENDMTKTYTADLGDGTIALGTNASCNSSGGCYTSRPDKALNAQNWVGSEANKANAVSGKAYVEMSGLKTTGATGINLDLKVWRNAKGSATHLVVLYKTAEDGTYEEVDDINIKVMDGENEVLKTYTDYTIKFGTEVNNQANLWIKLVPYGGTGYVSFDDIIISKNNPRS